MYKYALYLKIGVGCHFLSKVPCRCCSLVAVDGFCVVVVVVVVACALAGCLHLEMRGVTVAGGQANQISPGTLG